MPGEVLGSGRCETSASGFRGLGFWGLAVLNLFRLCCLTCAFVLLTLLRPLMRSGFRAYFSLDSVRHRELLVVCVLV